MKALLIEEAARTRLIDAGFGQFLGPKFGHQALTRQIVDPDPRGMDTVEIPRGPAVLNFGFLERHLRPRLRNAEIVGIAPGVLLGAAPERGAAFGNSLRDTRCKLPDRAATEGLPCFGDHADFSPSVVYAEPGHSLNQSKCPGSGEV